MTKRQKQIKYLIEYHSDILQHFIEEGAYPIRVSSYASTDTALLAQPWLRKTKDGLFELNKKEKFPDDLLAAWWKFRYNEVEEEVQKIRGKIDELNSVL